MPTCGLFGTCTELQQDGNIQGVEESGGRVGWWGLPGSSLRASLPGNLALFPGSVALIG